MLYRQALNWLQIRKRKRQKKELMSVRLLPWLSRMMYWAPYIVIPYNRGGGPFGLLPSIPDIYVEAICEGGYIKIFNYVLPSAYHYITVNPKGGKKRTEKAYTFADGFGKASWST